MSEGRVVSIHIAPDGDTLPHAVDRVRADAGLGLVGDRYYRTTGTGKFWARNKPGQDITLIEVEALEALESAHGVSLTADEARRNVVTRGIGLNALVGRHFFVGDVECRGDRLCDPCNDLQKMTKSGVLKGLVDRGGLRADIVGGGVIAVGDPIRVVNP